MQVPGLGGVEDLAVGDTFACALTQDGGVACWGDNTFGELGNSGAAPSGNTIPVQVQNLPTSIALFAGGNAACAAPLTGGLVCWGDNTYGELGRGTMSNTPSLAGPIPNFAFSGFEVSLNRPEVSLSIESACAVNAGGILECWGDNSVGELGDNMTGISTSSDVPVPVASLP
jgi:alpha-tubulin suppressor-like RCC1 family protein